MRLGHPKDLEQAICQVDARSWCIRATRAGMTRAAMWVAKHDLAYLVGGRVQNSETHRSVSTRQQQCVGPSQRLSGSQPGLIWLCCIVGGSAHLSIGTDASRHRTYTAENSETTVETRARGRQRNNGSAVSLGPRNFASTYTCPCLLITLYTAASPVPVADDQVVWELSPCF
jgi:hypothetical protein